MVLLQYACIFYFHDQSEPSMLLRYYCQFDFYDQSENLVVLALLVL
jgi:hypothetical protein